MLAVGIVSFILGSFAGTLIVALCIAAHDDDDRRERDADNFKS